MAADSWGEVLLNESFPLIVLCHGRGHLISSTGTWGKLPGNGNMEHTSTNFHKNYQAFITRMFFEKKYQCDANKIQCLDLNLSLQI